MVLRSMIDAVLARARMRKEIRNMSDLELSDLGMTRDRLGAIAGARPGLREQMAAMARIYGAPAEALKRPRWRALSLMETCAVCDKAGACAAWLDGCSDAAFSERDCPNRQIFQQAAV